MLPSSVYILVQGESSLLQMAAFWGEPCDSSVTTFAPSVAPDYAPTLKSSEFEVYWCIWLWCKGHVSHDGPAGQQGAREGTWLVGAKILNEHDLNIPHLILKDKNV